MSDSDSNADPTSDNEDSENNEEEDNESEVDDDDTTAAQQEEQENPEDMEWNDEHHRHATKLQAMTRGRRARKDKEDQTHSARKIQAIRRGRQTRRDLQDKKDQTAASIKIQASFRGKKSRKGGDHKHHHKHHHHKHHHHKHHHKQHKTPRGRHPEYVPENEYDEEHANIATKIQSIQRGRKARERQKYHKNREEYEQVAIKIQAAQRGRLVRNSEQGQLHRQLHSKQAATESTQEQNGQNEQETKNNELNNLLGQMNDALVQNDGNLENRLHDGEVQVVAAVKVQARARGYLARVAPLPERLQEGSSLSSTQVGNNRNNSEGIRTMPRLLRGADSLPKYLGRAFRHAITHGLATDLDHVFDLLDIRSEGYVSTDDLRLSSVTALSLECTSNDLLELPKAFGLKTEDALFQYRDFVDFCRKHNLYNFDNSAAETIKRNNANTTATTSTTRRGGGGALMRDIGASPRTTSGENSVTDYAEVVKYKQLVDDSTAQVESLTVQLRQREKDVRTLTDDVRSRERLNIRLQNENEIIRQETNALTTNRDRVQRELRRQVRLSQSLKQQVKQLEETMRGLERRVEAQRRELKLNEQTMELMDQSRKLAEGKFNVDT